MLDPACTVDPSLYEHHRELMAFSAPNGLNVAVQIGNAEAAAKNWVEAPSEERVRIPDIAPQFAMVEQIIVGWIV